MNRITLGVVAAAVLILAGCSQGDKKITLRYKYEPGARFAYEQMSKRHTRVHEADTLVAEKSTTYTVAVDQEIERFVDDSIIQMLEQDTFEWEQPSKTDSSKIDTVVHKREIRYQVLPNGKIVDFEFLSEHDITMVNLLKNYNEQGLPVFPAYELSVGDSWSQRATVILPEETMEASTTFTLKSLVREAGYDCAVIEYKGNMVFPVEPKPGDMKLRSGLDRIESKGVLYFAYKEGFVVTQREHWSTIGDRKELCEGKLVDLRIEMELDQVYSLKKKTE